MKKMRTLAVMISLLTAMALLPTAGSSYAMTAEAPAKGAQASANVAPQIIQNANGLDDCPVGRVCLWTSAFGQGLMVAWAAGDGHNDFTKIGCRQEIGCSPQNNFNDVASSWRNRTNMYYCVSWGINGGNPDNTMPPGQDGDFNLIWNNQASSIGFLGCP